VKALRHEAGEAPEAHEDRTQFREGLTSIGPAGMATVDKLAIESP